jgi:hypothetical protein
MWSIKKYKTEVLLSSSNCTKQSPSWEGSSLSATQQMSTHFRETEGSLPCSQEPATGLHHELDKSGPQLPQLFL